MGKGRDGTVPRKFVPIPLVPQTSVPVPVPRDTKSAGTDRDSPVSPVAMSPGSDHGDLRDGTGIPTFSRENRPSLISGIYLEN